ncbi:TetR family transcriptional regulator C-terminal domain-containing protein [Mesorhizobium sp.]|uniref:TetR family transcriptional regulator C-terminal domain-containing protein n=1 Tax=Mesorhizobium sp. TaxID=1871066 RepID=UPI0012016D77|nr:TetR family transcriptional regulator C-terminal domain-containing protein [Mesorhizobium sp.]TIO65367.1 MAG: TetR family transcriptional regulator [Mesorhizobium sp.]
MFKRKPFHKENGKGSLVSKRGNTRDQLVGAMRDALAKYGPEAPLSIICKAAGISPGNVHYQFGGRDALLEEAIRLQFRELADVMRRHRPANGDPIATLHSYIEANFDAEFYTPENCAIYRHLLSQSLLKDRSRRVQQLFHKRFVANASIAFRPLVGEKNMQTAAVLFVSTLNGVFIQGADIDDRIPPEMAKSLLYSALNCLLQNYRIDAASGCKQ